MDKDKFTRTTDKSSNSNDSSSNEISNQKFKMKHLKNAQEPQPQ